MKRRGRKSAAQTPAPQKERVYGSAKNPVGSAASKTSASKIQLSDAIVKTLEDKRNDFNEKHPTKKVSLATLKAVMRRGMGAYSKSHRPTITGGAPNSRQAWGFARVNKFLKKYAGQHVASFKTLPQPVRAGLVVLGAATLLFNGNNYLKNLKK